MFFNPEAFLVSGASYEALLSERGESYKTNANKVSYEALYEAPLTRKTRLEDWVEPKKSGQVWPH